MHQGVNTPSGSTVLSMLREAGLEPGDIVLSLGSSAASPFIAAFAGRGFSHAGLVLRDGVYLEAVTRGVRKCSVGTVAARRLAVFRVDGMAQPERSALALRAVDEAEHWVSLKYDLQGAVMSVKASGERPLQRRMFCSQLVATAYERAGLTLVHGKAAHKVTPGDLAASLRLREVSAQAVVQPSSVPDFLLDPGFETLSDREAVAAQRILDDAVPWFRERGLAEPESMMDVFAALDRLSDADERAGLDARMQRSMLDSGYLSLMTQAMEQTLLPFERESEAMRYDAIGGSVADAALDYLATKEANLRAYAADEQDTASFFDERWRSNGLPSFELLAWRYKANAAISERFADLVQERAARIRARGSGARPQQL
jgi:hypothetical protein